VCACPDTHDLVRLAEASFAGQPATLAATQRMKIEPAAMEVLSAKVRTDPRHGLLLCRPASSAHADLFRTTLVQYFLDKQAAGIIRVSQNAILYLVPPGDFVTEHLAVRNWGGPTE